MREDDLRSNAPTTVTTTDPGTSSSATMHAAADGAHAAASSLACAPPFARDRKIGFNPAVRDALPPPYDIIGDVHGCIDELHDLLQALGYTFDAETQVARHPDGRRLIFVGDLTDRGPSGIGVWHLVLASVAADTARFVAGNHDTKFVRWLMGRRISLSHGLAETVDELQALPPDACRKLGAAIANTVADSKPYLVLDEGRLVITHAGLDEHLIGRTDDEAVTMARYGDATGEKSPWGFPIRRDWAADYTGTALVVYGHTPTLEPDMRNNTINIDQGCAFGGRLTALRYPEMAIVSVPARATYTEPSMARRQSAPDATAAT